MFVNCKLNMAFAIPYQYNRHLVYIGFFYRNNFQFLFFFSNQYLKFDCITEQYNKQQKKVQLYCSKNLTN